MSPVETLLADVLRAHRYMATNQASRTGCHGCRWTFRPGQTERGRRAHEAHVAAEQAKALQAWLLTDEPEVALLLAEEGFRHSWDTSDERLIDGKWVAGLCCECGAFVPYGQEVAHVAAALALLLADLIGGTP